MTVSLAHFMRNLDFAGHGSAKRLYGRVLMDVAQLACRCKGGLVEDLPNELHIGSLSTPCRRFQGENRAGCED